MSLPSWLAPLLDAERMRATDAWAIEQQGIPGLELMERAGAGAAGVVADRAATGRAVVVAGKGNNGGDGLVIARLLREAGREVEVALAGDPDDLQGDPAEMARRLPGPPPRRYEPALLEGAAVIVDALLGTGSTGALREPARSAIQAMNAASAPVVAVDVPSGVNASTGEVADVAVRAAATATFHTAKPGLWISPGKSQVGDLSVIDIGIPQGGPGAADVGLILPDVLGLVPRRESSGTKFASGSVVVVGGSAGLTGAPCMACEAAMRAGAGYVTALVPASLEVIFETRLLEVMTVGLPDDGGTLRPRALDTVLERAAGANALVLGPGFGRAEETFELARGVAARAATPTVIDADGLNAHRGRIDDLAARPAPTVLTPHAGELRRLLDAEQSDVDARRLEHAREAARRSRAVVVLKGDDTLVADPGGRVGISPGDAPGLATAGTGDVLSGVIASALAKGLDPWTAACAGVLWHVRAGRRAAEGRGADGVIARDVIEALPATARP